MKLLARWKDREIEVEVEALSSESFAVSIDGKKHEVQCSEPIHNIYSLIVGQNSFEVGVSEPSKKDLILTHFFDETVELEIADPMKKLLEHSAAFAHKEAVQMEAEMPGKVVRILVEEGQKVEEGQPVLVLVAMKMENELEAPKSGKVGKIFVEADQNVETGTPLVLIE